MKTRVLRSALSTGALAHSRMRDIAGEPEVDEL
jgi:hypothetical protein